MSRSIICSDCGAKRENVQYKNTLYCHHCRLLRDLLFLGEKHERKCGGCETPFARTHTKDTLCGDCHYGSMYFGACALCSTPDAALHRPGIAVCIPCLRAPANRPKIINGLMKGLKARKAVAA
jgi:hypothetical protein